MTPRERDLFWPAVTVFLPGVILVLAMICGGCEEAHAAETASWYSYESCIKEGTNGRITASGAKFDHNALTAASWQYPFGTRLKVTSLSTNRSVIVNVTDRGPSKKLVKKGRVIDLSKGAFQRIAKLSDGVVPVKIEVLS